MNTTRHTPGTITPEDLTIEADRNYDLGRKHGHGERDALFEPVIAVLRDIDKLTCNCPCMSLQAQHEFERCKEAEAYKIALCQVIVEIRAQARAAIVQATGAEVQS